MTQISADTKFVFNLWKSAPSVDDRWGMTSDTDGIMIKALQEKAMTSNREKQGHLLAPLLAEIPHSCKTPVNGVRITAITADSRTAAAGTLFIALKGMHVDGHGFVRQAIRQGCRAVMVAKDHAEDFSDLSAQVIAVDDTRQAYATLAAACHGNPAERLTLIGITGTNGKTTTTYILEAICRAAGGRPGVIGTVNYRYGGTELKAPFTTPEPLCLHGLLRDMADAGVTHVIMEVSSHALIQGRLDGLRFDVAAFTNLSRDHLDFHVSMEEYFAAKKRLFTSHLKADGRAVIVCAHDNASDAARGVNTDWGGRLADELAADRLDGESVADARDGAGATDRLDGGSIADAKASLRAGRILRCGLRGGDLHVEDCTIDLEGITGHIATPAGKVAITSPLTGDFNLENILTAMGVAQSLGIGVEQIAGGLAAMAMPPGRLERVACRRGVGVFVDYAHTPDALTQALTSLRSLGPKRLVVVFGCGGDRDRGKRPLMGEVACRHADCIICTSDNPRSEEPAMILAEIERGMGRTTVRRQRAELFLANGLHGFYDVIESRREAIRTAVRCALAGDVILIAGKGHEQYQLQRGNTIFFDDRLESQLAGMRM